MITESPYHMGKVVLGCLVLSVSMSGTASGAEVGGKAASGGIRFEEVSAAAGVSQSGPSFGASWGFFNRDAYPDLWVSHHQFMPSLFVNRGDGTFSDVIDDIAWNGNPGKDAHGSAWGDFDGDGDQDLLETSGGLRSFMEKGDTRFGNNLYVNGSRGLDERAQALGLAFPTARGRHALWLELDGDGLLDAVLSNVGRGEQTFIAARQSSEGFQDVTEELGMRISRMSIFSSLAEVTGDHSLDLLVHAPAYPAAVFDLSGSRPRNVLNALELPITKMAKDVVLGDFDGDLRTDLYVVRYDLGASQWIQREPRRVQFHLFEGKGEEVGISFESPGEIQLALEPAWKYGVTVDKVYIGADGRHPDDVSTSLSPEDEWTHGIAPHRPGHDMGVFVGFDSSTGRWRILHSKTSIDDLEKLTGHIESDGPITDIEAVNFDTEGSETTDRFLRQRDGGFEDAGNEFGLDKRNACHTGAAADFDNDMDLDLYLVCTGVIGNAPNRLFENVEGKAFVEVEDAGGAAGSELGVGDSVATADYDNDGFIDLFVTNGFGPTPFNDGPQQLFRNRGNENHWLQLRLVGTVSNRDAVGARVIVTTPDGTKQLREQNGGTHWKSQNDQRLHFGLGPNRQAELIEIRWPSGLSQQLQDVEANQVLKVTEEGATYSGKKD